MENNYLQGLFLSFMIYMLYVETNPKMGGIFFRPDSTGVFKFSLLGIVPLLLYPFKSLDFWYPWNWDLNFIMFSNIGAFIYSFL